MVNPAWGEVAAALADARDSGRPTRFWLRDDDAVAVTPALERLGRLCEAAGMPILLAVIPKGATPALADWTAERPSITVAQHGWAHINHAVPPERACELGGTSSDEAVLADLRDGAVRLEGLFGAGAASILVPPWNRIRPSLVPKIAGAGYAALSTFGAPLADASGLRQRNCDLDIVDWRNGRRGRSIDDLCRRLVERIGHASLTGAPIGLLTHHLAHDEAAWSFLDDFFAFAKGRDDIGFEGLTTADA